MTDQPPTHKPRTHKSRPKIKVSVGLALIVVFVLIFAILIVGWFVAPPL